MWDELSELLKCPVKGAELSPAAQESLESLGSSWLASAIKPILIAYPGAEVRLDLQLQGVEPLREVNPGTYQHFPAENPQGHGFIQVESPAPNPVKSQYRLSRILVLPTLDLIENRAEYKFGGEQSDFKRRIIAKVINEGYKKTPLLAEMAVNKQRLCKGAELPLHRDLGISLTTPLKNLSDSAEGIPTMWVAMHWLEKGGAEAWAFEQIKLAKAAGFKVIVTTDKLGVQRDYERYQEIADEVLLVTHATGEYDWNAFAINLIKKYQISWLHIHHSGLAYARIHLLKAIFPGLRVEDSIHIMEYLNGGFVDASVTWGAGIDLHHVISPKLYQQLSAAGIPQEQLVYRPLTSLYVKESAGKTKCSEKPADPDEGLAPSAVEVASSPLRIGFLGRFAMQKRPLLFMMLAQKLQVAAPGQFEFIMQGDGELAPLMANYQRKHPSLQIKQLPWGSPGNLLGQVDVLLISSENEGLTLTSLEADLNNVLVVSCQVGSQETVIAKDCLVPVQPKQFLSEAAAVLQKLANSPAFFAQQLAEQHRLVQAVRDTESASEFFSHHYQNVLKH